MNANFSWPDNKGGKLQTAAPGEQGKTNPVLDSNWLQWSVEDFFGRCNWTGEPPALQEWRQQEGQPLPMTVTVGEFFRSLPWFGNPSVGSLPKATNVPEVAPDKERETTLADLLDLF